MHAIALQPRSGVESWIPALEATVEGRVIDVNATRSGRIDRVFVAEGEPVAKGATIVEIERVADGKPPERFGIHAPASGRVWTRDLGPGESASFGERILRLVEDDDVWVLARFRAGDFERLRIGQSAVIGSGARLLAAEVVALGPDDRMAVLDFVPRPVNLQPGMNASVLVIAR